MKIETFNALDAMRRAVAKSQGIDESELVMTVNCREQEVPEYFYDVEEFELCFELCADGHAWTGDLFNGGIVCEVCGIKDLPECEFCGETDAAKCPHFGS